MFKKQFGVKKNTNLRNSDTKKLLQRLSPTFGDVLPKKAQYAQAKIITFNGTTLNLYIVDKEPMFFDFDAAGVLFPTLYFTWIAPTVFPMLVVHEEVLHYLENGADLMLQGVIRREMIPLYEFNRGDAVTISVLTGGKIMGPMAVGITLMSAQEMIANKFEGKGVQILHIFRDLLWEFGSRSAPPVHDLLSIFNAAKTLEPSQGDEFPPLGSLSVNERSNEQQAEVVVHEGQQTSCDREINQGEANVIREEQQPEEPMDDLLYRCFLAALKYRLDKVPMDVGQFYSQCVLACVPKTRRLDMKKTKYKKFGIFLEEVNKGEDGPIVKIKKQGKGADVIDEVFKSHPALRSFVVTDEVIKDEEEDSGKCGPKIHEYYSVTDAVLPVLETRGRFSKGQLLESSEVREIVTDYVKKEDLHCGKTVRLDPILAQVTRINEESTDWNTLIQKVQSKMTKTFVLRMPDGRELVRKLNMPKIVFKVETRSGNKKVTLINNLAVFGIEPKRLCHQIQIEAATSATTSNEAVNCEGPQVTVLGNQVTYLGGLLMKEYGIDKKYIEGLDLGIKKKK
ncbi:hypothetical protein ANCCAN_10826 [Ancylostoma caninum]|uniref:SUI1 domain-containing protein n=1 Tax=Ancylostoma caninum TaxID=29170 RepID=A0A368GFM8_ANCCA|nr:hypothetical protein ANCCAN_10826 [Ancylostoma caninum]